MASRHAAWLVGMAALSGQALAGDEASAWRCWYNPPEHITCTPPAGAPARHPFLHIPLHNVPFDLPSVARLARAVICGSREPCAMRFSTLPPDVLELDRLLDPVLARAD